MLITSVSKPTIYILVIISTFIFGVVIGHIIPDNLLGEKTDFNISTTNNLAVLPSPSIPQPTGIRTSFMQLPGFFISSQSIEGIQGELKDKVFQSDLTEYFLQQNPKLISNNPNEFTPKFTFWAFSYTYFPNKLPNENRGVAITDKEQLLLVDNNLGSVRTNLPNFTLANLTSNIKFNCGSEDSFLFKTSDGGLVLLNWDPPCLQVNGFDSSPRILATIYFNNPLREKYNDNRRNAIQLLVNIPSYLDMEYSIIGPERLPSQQSEYTSYLRTYFKQVFDFLNSFQVKK
jgi:hypothetical protein